MTEGITQSAIINYKGSVKQWTAVLSLSPWCKPERSDIQYMYSKFLHGFCIQLRCCSVVFGRVWRLRSRLVHETAFWKRGTLVIKRCLTHIFLYIPIPLPASTQKHTLCERHLESITRERLIMCIDMRLDCSLSKCLILAFGNISIQNHDSSIYKKSNLWQNIKFELIDKIW